MRQCDFINSLQAYQTIYQLQSDCQDTLLKQLKEQINLRSSLLERIKRGDADFIERILQQNEQPELVKFCVKITAIYDNFDLCTSLLNRCDLGDCEDELYFLISWAVIHKNQLQFNAFLSRLPLPLKDEHFDTLVTLAFWAQDQDIINKLIEYDINFNALKLNPISLLHKLVGCKQQLPEFEFFKFLLDKGLAENEIPSSHSNLAEAFRDLCISAIQTSNQPFCDYLFNLDHEVKFNSFEKFKKEPFLFLLLMVSSHDQFPDLDFFKSILEQYLHNPVELNDDSKDYFLQTYLLAVKLGNLAFYDYLVDIATSKYEGTHLGITHRRALLTHSDNFNDNKNALMLAAENGHVDMFKRILELERSFQQAYRKQRRYTWTGLGQHNNLELFCNKNSENKTALMLAAENGHVEIVRCILNHENFLDHYLEQTTALEAGEYTALALAAERDHHECVELLLKAGALSSDEHLPTQPN